MSGLKPRRRSSSLTICRSLERSGSSTSSSTVGVGVGTTSWVTAGGGVSTGWVSTSIVFGGVAGFFFGHPYRNVNSTGTTIHIIHLRFMLVSPYQNSAVRTAWGPLTVSRLRGDSRPVGHVVVALLSDLAHVAAVHVHDVDLLAPAALRDEGDLAPVRREGRGLVLARPGGQHPGGQVDHAGDRDLEPSAAPAGVGDQVPLGAPGRAVVVVPVEGQAPLVRPLGVHEIDVRVAGPAGGEGDLAPARAPGRVRV